MARWWWVLVVCAALATPTALEPGSDLADSTYLIGSLVLTASLWWSVLHGSGPLRRIIALFAAAASCWLVGDLLQRVLTVPDAAITLPDAFWMSSYPLVIAAVIGILKQQGVPHPVRREIILDSVVISAAATVAAWHLLIAPYLGRSSFSSAVVTAIYPLGDVAVFTFALTLLMLPGRSSTPGRLIIGCLVLTLPLDFVNVTLSLITPQFDVDRLDAVFLIVNSMLAGAALHPRRNRLVQPNDQIGEHRLNGWRVVVLGVSLTAVVTLGALPGYGRVNLIPSLVASVIVCMAIIARFYLAVREREAAESALTFQAHHDPLTGVGNRLMLVRQLARATERATLRALIYIDLDGFKDINDTWGHPAGDAVLSAVAQRVAAFTRDPDVIARVGGDEFVVLCDDLDLPDAETLAHRLLNAIGAPIDVGPATVTVGASIGVILVADPVAGGAGIDVEDMLQAVDGIMYRAKRAGGGVLVDLPAAGREHTGLEHTGLEHTDAA